MSYINDALRRAQNEKDVRYAPYGAILSANPHGRKRSRKRIFLFAGTAAALAAAAVLSFLVFSPASIPGTARKTPDAKTASRSSVQAPVQPASRPVTPDPAAIYRAALDAQKNGRLEEAESGYRKILEEQPGHAAALNNLGVIYLTKGRMEEAVGFFNLALAQEGVNADPYYNLACIYARLKDPGRALGYLRTAALMEPEVRQWARTDQDLSTLRSNPEFKKITE